MNKPRPFSEYIEAEMDSRGWDAASVALASGCSDDELDVRTLVVEFYLALDDMHDLEMCDEDAAMFSNAFGGSPVLWRRRHDSWRQYRKTVNERLN